MENKQNVTTVFSVIENNFFKTLANAENVLSDTKAMSDRLSESFNRLSSYTVAPQSFEVFKQSAQEASTLIDKIGAKLKQNFTPVVENPSFTGMIDAVDTTIKDINGKLKQFHIPNMGKMLMGDDSVFGSINSNIDKVTQSFGGMAQGFGDKQKQMISGMSNWKQNLAGFTENTKYQMKLFTMAMRTEGSPVDKLGTAFETVSTKVTSSFSKMYQSSGMMGSAFRQIGEGVNGVKTYMTGLPESARDQMKLLGMHIRSEHPALAELGTKFSDMSSQVGGTISNVTSKFGTLGSKFTDTISNSSLLKGAFSGIGTTLQGSANVGTTAMTSMVQGLSSVFGFALKALGPAAILGVALAGFGLLDSQFDGQIGKMIETATTKGPAIIAGFVQGIIDKLPALMETGTQLIAGLAQAISVNLPVIMQSAVDLINALVSGVIESLPTLIPAALMLIESLATSLLSAAPQLLMTGLDLLMALVSGIVDNKDQIIATVKRIIESFTTNITGQLPEIIKKGVEILTKLAEGIASILPVLIPVAIEAIATLVRTLSEQLPTIISAAVKIISTLVAGLLKELPSILVAAGKLIWELTKGILGALPSIATVGYQIINELSKALFDIDLFEVGGNIIQGFIDGITEKAQKIGKVLENIGNGIKDFFTGNFKIHSPSRWMRDEIGAMLPAGLAIGIERNAHVVDQPMDKLASQIMLPSLDSLDQQVETIQDVSVQSSSKQMMIQTKQPATFNIKLGNQQFKAFVSDISEAMGQDSAINLAF
ncbi:phage tail protein [Enterococcus ureasiticus]|uniref:Phage tail protein n=1 Tax=Enterococcus ureasiticus TaxID=903984 RepID=A0A1E5GFU8_9ENTE|nr:hypothetical protein [Enterococcus ureasiticus]OEG11501.1 hypothetical protein BCR21_09410 [Enterococcus ureasiticus]